MDTSVEEQETYSLKEGDVLLTRTSETLDELGMSSVAVKNYPKATFSGFLKRLCPTQTDVVYHKFLAFYLRSPLFRKAMNNNAVMTLRCSLNEQIFSYLDLLLPEFDQQKKIGDLLFQIYAKIELNNRINAELEGMAKLLYDYWFVQFDFPMSAAQAAALGKPHLTGHPYRASGGKMIYNETLKRDIPEGWEVCTLSQVAKTCSGGTPLSTKREYYDGGNIPWINSGELHSPYIVSASNFITQSGLDNSSAKLLPANTLLIALYGATAGKVSLLLTEACLNQAVCGVIPTSLKILFYLKFVLSDLYSHLVMMSSGSARDNLSQDLVRNIKVIIPQSDILGQFDEFVSSGAATAANNIRQNQELTQLRDWLLPMLMNGQVTVG